MLIFPNDGGVRRSRPHALFRTSALHAMNYSWGEIGAGAIPPRIRARTSFHDRRDCESAYFKRVRECIHPAFLKAAEAFVRERLFFDSLFRFACRL